LVPTRLGTRNHHNHNHHNYYYYYYYLPVVTQRPCILTLLLLLLLLPLRIHSFSLLSDSQSSPHIELSLPLLHYSVGSAPAQIFKICTSVRCVERVSLSRSLVVSLSLTKDEPRTTNPPPPPDFLSLLLPSISSHTLLHHLPAHCTSPPQPTLLNNTGEQEQATPFTVPLH